MKLSVSSIFDLGVFKFSTGNQYKQKDTRSLEVIPVKTVPADILAQTIKKRAQRRKRGVDGDAKPGVSFWDVYNPDMY